MSDPETKCPAMVLAFNEITGCEYSPDDFSWDVFTAEKCTTYFSLGWDACESGAIDILHAIVEQYDAAPDGPLGKGFTNGPFLRAKEFLQSHNQPK